LFYFAQKILMTKSFAFMTKIFFSVKKNSRLFFHFFEVVENERQKFLVDEKRKPL